MSWFPLDIGHVVERIRAGRAATPRDHGYLVAISGIDGCGKGLVADKIAARVQELGHVTATISVDGWLNLPSIRFSTAEPGEHFYRHAIRFDDMFRDVIGPLRENRSVRAETDFTEETANDYRRHSWQFDSVDVILVEGIFLFKRELRHHYDMTIWIDCSLETALERALARRQEGLSAKETEHAYRTIYFPAQQVHSNIDEPQSFAEMRLINDARLL